MLTQDCPVGMKRKRRRKLAFGIASATALTAAAVTSALRYTMTERCRPLMGAPVPMVIGSATAVDVPEVEVVKPPPPGTQVVMGGLGPPQHEAPHVKMGRVKPGPGQK